jgi:hypothetical protein
MEKAAKETVESTTKKVVAAVARILPGVIKGGAGTGAGASGSIASGIGAIDAGAVTGARIAAEAGFLRPRSGGVVRVGEMAGSSWAAPAGW